MIPPLPFRGNDRPTLGVELELQLVDAGSMALRSAIGELLEDLPADLHDSVKPEFMQCYVEVNSAVGRTVDDLGADLGRKLLAVERAADRRGLRLFWAATHPFSCWRDQRITPDERYYKLADLLGETVVRPVTFGLHVHVGVDSGDKAVRVGDRLQRHLPLLLALSANSPFWHARPTGDHAHRIGLLEGIPTGGLPPRLRSWDEYLGLLGRLRAAGFVASPKELWWDVRPSSEHGTVEVRICDMPPDLPGVLALTALIQCLVQDLSDAIDRGVAAADDDPLMVRQNRWRAGRFGPEAVLVDPETLEGVPARRAAERLVRRLRGRAEDLGCARPLERVLDLAHGPTGSQRQVALYEQTGDLAEVVRRLVGQSRLTREPPRDAPAGWPGGIAEGGSDGVIGPRRGAVSCGLPAT